MRVLCKLHKKQHKPARLNQNQQRRYENLIKKRFYISHLIFPSRIRIYDKYRT